MEGVEVFRYDRGNTRAELEEWAGACDFVFHLAGVNRPKDPAEFAKGNAGFTEDLLELLARRPVPVLLSSSIQAALDNDYGKSKAAAEEAVRAYGARTGAPVYVYRLANVFGKWCRPNYNSAVATWCHNIARDLPIQVRDPAATVTLVYIDDVVESFIGCLEPRNTRNTRNEFLSVEPSYTKPVGEVVGGCEEPRNTRNTRNEFLSAEPSYTKSLGEIVELVRSFHDEPKTLDVPDQRDGFAKKLYATYLSYLPEDQFAYPLTMHVDNRGSFTEILHTAERGQVSVNVSHPGITKGQHWHHTKHEKFLVVSGEGAIRFRKMDDPDAQVITYRVSGAKLEVVRIPPGYTHNIENLGTTDMVTVMWANEVFDPQRPDTFREEV
jgi:UDP-2-acetamido-2,6-beta-L-arabino-hexul-4-ose reductase